MASKHGLHLLMIIFFLPIFLTGATEHIVGGDKGWGLEGDYKVWAQSQTFYIGDTLVFNYREGDHNVISVAESDFETCTVPPGTAVLSSGKDVVKLTTPGSKWYICGIPEHCAAADQKLAMTVLQSSPPSTLSAQPPSSSFSCILMSGFHVILIPFMLIVFNVRV